MRLLVYSTATAVGRESEQTSGKARDSHPFRALYLVKDGGLVLSRLGQTGVETETEADPKANPADLSNIDDWRSCETSYLGDSDTGVVLVATISSWASYAANLGQAEITADTLPFWLSGRPSPKL